jgi:dTDP-4-amino-4,6-dideoxygalactose transaminase
MTVQDVVVHPEVSGPAESEYPAVRIPYGHQVIEEDDIEAVLAVLRSDRITQGPAVAAFEDLLAATTGARHAVAFSSGTSALHAACTVAGFKAGDQVGTSALSFVASANAIRYTGAEPVLLDVDPSTLNGTVDRLPADWAGAVIVHFAGLPAALPDRQPGQVLIEDAAHALGAQTAEGPVGNCARSDLCCFSFHPVKAVTTGEGGAVTTNSATLAAALRRVRNHGMTPAPAVGGWAYDVTDLGWNYRLTDLQAALGHSQLGKLEHFIARRNELAQRYRAALAGSPVILPPAATVGVRHAYHLFVVQVARRDQVYDRLRRAGIGVQVHYIPIYRHTLYRDRWSSNGFPGIETVADRLLSLPLYSGLGDDDQDEVVRHLAEAL